MTTGKTIALTRRTFVGNVLSLLLNMLSRLVITFLPKSKHLLISVGNESACNVAHPSSNPGLRKSIAEGIGYPLQYSWASFVAQLVKNLPAMWETWV